MKGRLLVAAVGVPLLLLVVLALAVDVLFGAFLLGLSPSLSVVDAMVYRALPCALYDCVLGLLLYPLAARATGGRQAQMTSVTPDRLR